MSDTVVAGSNLRPTDIAWAQNLIADLQRDDQLRTRWQQAEAAFSYSESQQEPNPERGLLLSQLIHIGQALEADVTRLQLIWEHSYAPATTPEDVVASLQARIFGHAA
jgi:hypothetical protein